MSDLKEKMKQEAIGRMVSLNLHPKAINEFKDEEKLNLSLEGFLYWLDEEQTQRVKKFEEETKCMVYHVIQNQMTIGQMLTFLYVSNVEEEWEMERNDLEVGLPIAYVVNVDHDICSELLRWILTVHCVRTSGRKSEKQTKR